MMGIDGQVPEHTKALIAEEKKKNRTAAALVTGPQKIFNDAALAVEKLSADLGLMGHRSAAATGILQADLAAIKSLMPQLPHEDAALCQSVMERTGQYMNTLGRLEGIGNGIKINDVSLTLAAIYPEFGEVSGVNRAVNLMTDAIFAEAGANGKFQDFCEYARRRLEAKALVP